MSKEEDNEKDWCCIVVLSGYIRKGIGGLIV